MKYNKDWSDAEIREGLADMEAIRFECFSREQAEEDAGNAAILAFVRLPR